MRFDGIGEAVKFLNQGQPHYMRDAVIRPIRGGRGIGNYVNNGNRNEWARGSGLNVQTLPRGIWVIDYGLGRSIDHIMLSSWGSISHHEYKPNYDRHVEEHRYHIAMEAMREQNARYQAEDEIRRAKAKVISYAEADFGQ